MASLFSSSPFNSQTLHFLLISLSFIFLIYLHFTPINSLRTAVKTHNSLATGDETAGGGCGGGLSNLHDHPSKCFYVKSESDCDPQGYIHYLQIFYCVFGEFPVLGHLILAIWLFALFYLIGDTAANYFCPSLESLSKFLKLSPTIAGVTLLSLGNGAPDLFSSIVSFSRSNNGDFGLNSVLGGAFFVSSFVVGTICVLIGSRDVWIDKNSFIRDVVFLLISLGCLCLIVFIGKITIWAAVCYVGVYFVYVGFYSASHFFSHKKPKPELILRSNEELAEMGIPLLGYVEDENPISHKKTTQEPKFQEKEFEIPSLDSPRTCRSGLSMFLRILELPLYLPRRFTIPVVSEQRWSKLYAVVSAIASPVLLTELYSFQRNESKRSLNLYIVSGFIGLILGILAFFTTKRSHPPKKSTSLWLIGSFVMSVTWTYIIAQELVSLLVALGIVFGISPSVLGLTVLAWGNSLGDLIANVTMATQGGPDGAQIALSGCYAGPIFNTVIGLGVPLVMSSLAEYPRIYVISRDSSLYETLGFLIAGLLWALVVLLKKDMKLDRLVGGGLIAIYFCFLFLRLSRVFGILKLDG